MLAPKSKSQEAFATWDKIQSSNDLNQIKFFLERLKREVVSLEAVDLSAYFFLSGVVATYNGDIDEAQRKFILLKQSEGSLTALLQAVPVCLNLGLFSVAAVLIEDMNDPVGLSFSDALAFSTTKLFGGDFSACQRALAYMNVIRNHQEVRNWEMFVVSNVSSALALLECNDVSPQDFASTVKGFEELVRAKLPLNSLEYVANFDVIDDGIVIHYDVPESKFDEVRVINERDVLLDVLMELDSSIPATMLTADIWTTFPDSEEVA